MNLLSTWRRILIIDDNQAIHDDINKILKNSAPSNDVAAMEAAIFGDCPISVEQPQYDLVSALQGREGCEYARHALQENRPFAMAFVDMRMPPGWDGLETIQHLFEVDANIQVVVCTAFSDYSWEQMLERLGMTDRVLLLKKPFDHAEIRQLAAALTEKWKLKRQAELKVGELEAMVHARTHELREQALHDRLTGMPNRTYVLEHLNKAIRDAEANHNKRSALIFIDFDHFKNVNDSLGHDIGDELLLEISVRIRGLTNGWIHDRCISGASFAARLAGDEFVIFLDQLSDTEEIGKLGMRLLETLNVPYGLKGYDVLSTASVGIAQQLAEYRRAEEMLRDADMAMFRAKRAGGDRVIEFSPEMRDEITTRIGLENDLRRAVQKPDQFYVVFQPIVDLEKGTLKGFEALVRWHHETRGVVMPGEFIPVAEESNLIIPIEKIMIAAVCRQLSAWRRMYANANRITVSVNVSQRHFNNVELTSFLARMLDQYKIPPKALKIEVTESAVMSNLGVGREIMRQITDLGVDLHMDDFGTGYSSLNCLHGLPLRTLKIDRSFIVTMTLKRDYAAVISAIIQLASNLGMRVVAEGVETREQVIMLQALGCDQAQGFYFSKPLAPEEAAKFFSVSCDRMDIPQFTLTAGT